MKNLTLKHNRIESIDVGQFLNPDLTYLDLSNNEISSMTDTAFKGLPNLKSLYLRDCCEKSLFRILMNLKICYGNVSCHFQNKEDCD